MRTTAWTSAGPLLGAAVLILAACGDDSFGEVPLSARYKAHGIEPPEDRVFRPSQLIVEDPDGTVEFRHVPGENGAGVEIHHLRCDDEALAAKTEQNGIYQPSGWPRDWDGTGEMPDPYCHPDYLEVGEWIHLEAFSAAWEGRETSTLADIGQSQESINQGLWDQSRARALWTP